MFGKLSGPFSLLEIAKLPADIKTLQRWERSHKKSIFDTSTGRTIHTTSYLNFRTGIYSGIQPKAEFAISKGNRYVWNQRKKQRFLKIADDHRLVLPQGIIVLSVH